MKLRALATATALTAAEICAPTLSATPTALTLALAASAPACAPHQLNQKPPETSAIITATAAEIRKLLPNRPETPTPKPSDWLPKSKYGKVIPEESYVTLRDIKPIDEHQISNFFELQRQKICQELTLKEARPFIEKILQDNPELFNALQDIAGPLYKLSGRGELPNKSSSFEQKIGCEKSPMLYPQIAKYRGVFIYCQQDQVYFLKILQKLFNEAKAGFDAAQKMKLE